MCLAWLAGNKEFTMYMYHAMQKKSRGCVGKACNRVLLGSCYELYICNVTLFLFIFEYVSQLKNYYK